MRRAIFLAFGLFTLGTILLTVGVLILTGHIDAGDKIQIFCCI